MFFISQLTKLFPITLLLFLSVFVVSVWQNLAIDGDIGVAGASGDACQCTFAVVEQGDGHIGIDVAAHKAVSQVHVTFIVRLDMFVRHLAFPGPSSQAVWARVAPIEGKLDDAVLVLCKHEVGLGVDVIMAVSHAANLYIVRTK